MRKLVRIISIIAMLIALSMPVMAFKLPNTWVEDNNTMIGVFKVADNTNGVLDFWQAWKSSDRNLCLMTLDNKFVFIIVPSNCRAIYTVDSASVIFTFSNGLTTDDAVVFEYQDGAYIFATWQGYLPNYGYDFKGIVSSTYFPGPFTVDGYNYLAEYTGALGIVDDLGASDEGILGWLKSFWDKFISLFVPRDGFFDDWFKELRAAFSKKTGGFDVLMAHFQSSFEKLKSYDGQSRLVIGVPSFFGGSGSEIDLTDFVQPILAFIRPVLTGVFLLLTAVSCYKRIIALVNT